MSFSQQTMDAEVSSSTDKYLASNLTSKGQEATQDINRTSRHDTEKDSNTPAGRKSSDVVQTLQPGQKQIYKIIVIGDSNVGKTCLTFRFCGGKFPERCEATIGVDFREKTMQIGGEEIKLQIWDTAGQERFRRSMVQHYYRNVHAVVFVYDVTKISTFDNLTHWVEECSHNSLAENVPRILVGNKCDQKDRIAVTTSMAQKFAEFHDMILFETSAKDEAETDQIDGIFMTIACRLSNVKSSSWYNHGSPTSSNQTLRNLSKSSSSRPSDTNRCFC